MNSTELVHLKKSDRTSSSGMASELQQFDDLLWTERSCVQCGQYHGYRPTFEGVKTSIDVIPELLRRWNTLE